MNSSYMLQLCIWHGILVDVLDVVTSLLHMVYVVDIMIIHFSLDYKPLTLLYMVVVFLGVFKQNINMRNYP